jgi:diguanylate cyclase (GGDEF)-like protein
MPLEAEFRAQYVARNMDFLRVAAVLGLILIGLYALLDSQLLANTVYKPNILLKLGTAVPMLLLLVSTYPGKLMRHTGRWVLAAAGGLSLGTLLLPAWAAAPAAQALFAAPVGTVFIYLMLGLRLGQALWFAVPSGGVLIVLQAQGGGDAVVMAYGSLFLIFANVVGALSCYRLEHTARSAFLERQLVGILGGSDAVTGIPNRRYFNAHLQRAHRQAQRDLRSIAVALVEIDRLDEYRNKHGAQAADNALRRIAQTVMKSARRPLDFAARFGAAEIVLLLYAPDKDRLHSFLKAVRAEIALVDMGHPNLPGSSYLTVTIGASWTDNGANHDCQTLLESADRALQEAKRLEGLGMAILPAAQAPRDSSIMAGPWAGSGSAAPGD